MVGNGRANMEWSWTIAAKQLICYLRRGAGQFQRDHALDNHTGTVIAVLRWGSCVEAALVINRQPWAGVLEFGEFQHCLPTWKIQAGLGSITHMLWMS